MDERTQQIEAVYRERYVGFRNALATVTGDYDTARDALQEGFARALRERRRFRGEAPIEAWIFRIALRCALETRRPGEPSLDSEIPAALVDESGDPALAAAVRALAPRRRLVVFLRYFADFSYAQIAAVLDVTEGTVAATLAQAHDALRDSLRPQEVRQ